MTFAEYVDQARLTAQFPEDAALVYPALKVMGEAGEVADKVGKLIRDFDWRPGEPVPADFVRALALELGDVAWYAAAYCWTFSLDPDGLDDALVYGAGSGIEFDVPSLRLPRLVVRLVDASVSLSRWSFTAVQDHDAFTLVADVLYSVGALAAEIGVPVERVLELNVEKLRSRRERGVIAGSGDER